MSPTILWCFSNRVLQEQPCLVADAKLFKCPIQTHRLSSAGCFTWLLFLFRFSHSLTTDFKHLPVSSATLIHEAMEQCFVGSLVQLGFHVISPCRSGSQITRSSPVQLKNISLQQAHHQQKRKMIQLPRLTTSIMSKIGQMEDSLTIIEILNQIILDLDNPVESESPSQDGVQRVGYKVSSEAHIHGRQSFPLSLDHCCDQKRSFSFSVSPLVLSCVSSSSSSAHCDTSSTAWQMTPVSTNLHEDGCLSSKQYLSSGHQIHFPNVGCPSHNNSLVKDMSPLTAQSRYSKLHESQNGIEIDRFEWSELPSSEDLSAFLADMSLEEDEIHSAVKCSYPISSNGNALSVQDCRTNKNEKKNAALYSSPCCDNTGPCCDNTGPCCDNTGQCCDNTGPEYARKCTCCDYRLFSCVNQDPSQDDYSEFPSSDDLDAFLADMDTSFGDACEDDCGRSVSLTQHTSNACPYQDAIESSKPQTGYRGPDVGSVIRVPCLPLSNLPNHVDLQENCTTGSTSGARNPRFQIDQEFLSEESINGHKICTTRRGSNSVALDTKFPLDQGHLIVESDNGLENCTTDSTSVTRDPSLSTGNQYSYQESVKPEGRHCVAEDFYCFLDSTDDSVRLDQVSRRVDNESATSTERSESEGRSSLRFQMSCSFTDTGESNHPREKKYVDGSYIGADDDNDVADDIDANDDNDVADDIDANDDNDAYNNNDVADDCHHRIGDSGSDMSIILSDADPSSPLLFSQNFINSNENLSSTPGLFSTFSSEHSQQQTPELFSQALFSSYKPMTPRSTDLYNDTSDSRVSTNGSRGRYSEILLNKLRNGGKMTRLRRHSTPIEKHSPVTSVDQVREYASPNEPDFLENSLQDIDVDSKKYRNYSPRQTKQHQGSPQEDSWRQHNRSLPTPCASQKSLPTDGTPVLFSSGSCENVSCMDMSVADCCLDDSLLADSIMNCSYLK
ncbi:uncharacterized protein LOC5516515 isoform X2 [Nematostella vectensis]|uniref:uncharacterized protein LOC5516515 isoform X2 n=1 Tax=Nematostella vectensis TaxID=45351 RepID=UPI002077338B|nr:uncharacterized protein LOC5516515 isoform X2 [Nematostella vectensis]